MGHYLLIQLIVLLIYMFCKQGGCENESWTSYVASDSAITVFHQCKNSNLATFWKNALLLKQTNTLPGFYVNINDLETPVLYETGQQCKLNFYAV